MYHIINVVVYVILFTKFACEGQAGEMLQPVPVNRVDIKPDNEGREQSDVDDQWDSNEDTFPVLVKSAKCDVGQEGKREQQTTEETKDVGNVVDPWQEAAHEEEKDNAQ